MKLPSSEQRMQRVLHDGLAVAACDGQDFGEELPPLPGCNCLQRAQRIRNNDQGPKRIQSQISYSGPGDHRRGSAVAECMRQKTMAVRLLAFERNEQRAGRRAARVRADSLNAHRQGLRLQFAADDLSDSVKLRWDQGQSLPRGRM